MLGSHVIKTWSSTQPSVTLSSGEAEYYGVVKAAGAGVGQQSLLKDMGHRMPHAAEEYMAVKRCLARERILESQVTHLSRGGTGGATSAGHNMYCTDFNTAQPLFMCLGQPTVGEDGSVNFFPVDVGATSNASTYGRPRRSLEL